MFDVDTVEIKVNEDQLVQAVDISKAKDDYVEDHQEAFFDYAN